MKKLLGMILCLMLALSMAACGGSKPSGADSATSADGSGKENGAEAGDTAAEMTEMTVEAQLGGDAYDITFACPADSKIITEVPEVSEDENAEITPEDQEIIDLYESVKPLYVNPPMLVCDKYVMTWNCDWYSYPYDAKDMEEHFEKLQENGVSGLELTEINGQKAILQDYDSMYIVRVATENPDMYVEFQFVPNDAEALEQADGNMIASPYIDVAREFIESDLLKAAYEGIQIKKK